MPTVRWLLPLVLILSGCATSDDPQWQLAITADSSVVTDAGITLTDPQSWAVAVAHEPRRMGAVLPTQRLVSEWADLVGAQPVAATANGQAVTISAPTVSAQGLQFPATGTATSQTPASLVMAYDRPLRYSFDLPPAVGWTYVLTFGPGARRDTKLTAALPSPVTLAVEGRRSRSLATATALPSMTGAATLVLLDNRTYSADTVTVLAARTDGKTVTLELQDGAVGSTFNRGALFVDGLPTPP